MEDKAMKKPEVRFPGWPHPASFVAFVTIAPTAEVRVRRRSRHERRWVCDACGPSNTPDCIHKRAAAAAVRQLHTTEGERP